MYDALTELLIPFTVWITHILLIRLTGQTGCRSDRQPIYKKNNYFRLNVNIFGVITLYRSPFEKNE